MSMRLDDFAAAPEAKQANLTKVEVAALRFYTSHSFDAISEPLRDEKATRHPLPLIALCCSNALGKLCRMGADEATSAKPKPSVSWRGFREAKPSSEFVIRGGVEP